MEGIQVVLLGIMAVFTLIYTGALAIRKKRN